MIQETLFSKLREAEDWKKIFMAQGIVLIIAIAWYCWMLEVGI